MVEMKTRNGSAEYRSLKEDFSAECIDFCFNQANRPVLDLPQLSDLISNCKNMRG